MSGRRSAAFLPAFLPVFLAAAEAFARAGGGEHYSGGHSSSSSGSYGGGYHGGGGSSGDGDGRALFELAWFLFRLTVEHPLVMIPLWIVVILLFLWFNSMRDGVAAPIRRIERERLALPTPSPGIAAIRARDPGFDPQAFTDRAARSFKEIQEAWFRRNLAKSRHLMSDGLFRRFTTLQGLMTLEGRRDAIADVRVLDARIAVASGSGAFDSLTVRVDASLRDTEVSSETSDDDARRAASRTPAERFVELWTFLRRPGAKSQAGHDLSQGNCPNCGAPFTGGMANTCEYCKAVVNSGAFDWVLSEITQEEEFLPHTREAPGLADLRARDPSAAPEVLEDRALLLFWKWLEAYASNSAKPLGKVARPELVQQVSAALARFRDAGDLPVVKLPAVGGADVVAVESDLGVDRVHVDVRWSGIVSLTPGSGLGRLAKRPLRHVVQMVRRTDAAGDAGTGLATERCGNCGAPLTDSDRPTCEYCGHDLTSAAKDWVLEAIVPWEAWRRPSQAVAGARAFSTSNERTRLLQTLTALAKADGIVDDAEKKLLRDCARRWGVPWSQVAVMLEGNATLPIDGMGALPQEQARVLLAEMVRMVKLDGRVHRRERELLGEAAERLGVPQGEVERLLVS